MGEIQEREIISTRKRDILGYFWKASRRWTYIDEVKGIPGGGIAV